MKNKTILVSSFVLLLATMFLLQSCKEEKLADAPQQPASRSYHTEFDSIGKVIADGWRAVNKSQPASADTWQQGSYIADNIKGGPFQSGIPARSFVASANEYALCPYIVGTGLSFLNCWLLTPQLSMKNGDRFSFWTRTKPTVSYPDRMQVWLNTTNDGTNVGQNENETGDFTVKLLDLNPTYSITGYPTTWTKYEFVISGLPYSVPKKLRIGFRYYVQGGGPSGSNSDEIGLDDFEFISQ